MPACERCWSDAALSLQGDQVEEYRRLIEERDCTPEEQAGEEATVCGSCGRVTVHQYARVCMACGAESSRGGAR